MSMLGRWRARLAVAALVAAPVALFLWSFTAAPLDPPAAFDGPAPVAAPPTGMSLSKLPTGVTHRSAAFAYRGGSFTDARDFSMTAVLVRHPRGDVLIDTGFGKEIDAHFGMMPASFRVGDAYDNAMCESLFASLECELLDRRRFRTQAKAKLAAFQYIEGFYNSR